MYLIEISGNTVIWSPLFLNRTNVIGSRTSLFAAFVRSSVHFKIYV